MEYTLDKVASAYATALGLVEKEAMRPLPKGWTPPKIVSQKTKDVMRTRFLPPGRNETQATVKAKAGFNIPKVR